MEEEIKESNSLHDLKEEFVESDIAAAIENDEVNNEEIQNSNEVDPMDKLSYADGKERDEIDEKEAEEKLMGADKISPFGTNDTMVFKRKLERMDFSQKAHLAHRVAARVFADQELQDESLVRAFHEWRSSISDFEQNLKGKTLSELQEMAMKLGFTPSYDRIRLTSALRQEYLKRG